MRKASERDVIVPKVELHKKIPERNLIPFAGDLIERNIQGLLVLLVQIHHYHVSVLIPQIGKDGMPLVAAYDRPI